MSTKYGYASVQVKDEIRDFIKHKQAKALIKTGKKLLTSDIIQKAMENTYEKELKAFRKIRKEIKESED